MNIKNLKILDNLVQKQEIEQTNKNIKTNQELDSNIPPTSTFSIDIDPFSSSSSSLSFTNSNQVDPFFDNPTAVQLFDPFSDLKMTDQNPEETFSDALVDNDTNFENNFEPKNDPIPEKSEPGKTNQESDDDGDSVVEINSQLSESSDSYSFQRKIKDEVRDEKLNEEEKKEQTDDEKDLDDDMDSAFQTFNLSEARTVIGDDMPDMANDLAEAGRQLDVMVEEENKELDEPSEVYSENVQSNLVKSELVSDETETSHLSRNRVNYLNSLIGFTIEVWY